MTDNHKCIDNFRVPPRIEEVPSSHLYYYYPVLGLAVWADWDVSFLVGLLSFHFSSTVSGRVGNGLVCTTKLGLEGT